MSRGRSDRGAAAVEFALVFPILMMLVMGIVDFGYAMNRDAMLGNAAREGVRAASLGATSEEVAHVVHGGLPSGMAAASVVVDCLLPTGEECTSYAAGATSGGTAIVTVDYDHDWVTPVGDMFLGGDIELSATSKMRIE